MKRKAPDPFGELSLYAIVPSADSAALNAGRRGLRLVTVGRFTAIAGKAATGDDRTVQALAHDRVVRRAVAACSSVVPFRLGSNVASEEAVVQVIHRHRTSLAAMLDRFFGRVEMGIKIRLSPDSDLSSSPVGAVPPALRCALHRIHALTSAPEDRQEGVRRELDKVTFQGSYLIKRSQISEFWRAVEEMRRAEPASPLLGSGPWAPYSFCSSLRQEEAA